MHQLTRHFDLNIFLLFAVLVIIGLIAFLIYASPGTKKTNIPGPRPSDKHTGNLGDVLIAGSLHQYLLKIHQEYGPITGFFWGDKFVASLAHPKLLKNHAHLFDRASELFLQFEPMLSSYSIQYANGSDGRDRRLQYDRFFSHESMTFFIPKISDSVESLIVTLTKNAKEHSRIPLHSFMLALAIKSIVRISFESDPSFLSDADILALREQYDIVWSEMERRLTEGEPSDSDPRLKVFNKALARLHEFVNKIINRRKSLSGLSEDKKLFIDFLIEHWDGKPNGDSYILADAITYLVGGFHTSGNLITWTLYQLCLRTELASQLRNEISEVKGKGELNVSVINQMVFLRRLINESLRYFVLAPWAARYQNEDAFIGGYLVPKDTPVIHALGVTGQDPELFPDPDEFDPDKHFGDNVAFDPFGVGRRKCPGYRLAYLEASVWLVTLISKFNWKLADPEFRAVLKYGLVTSPMEEIYVNVDFLH